MKPRSAAVPSLLLIVPVLSFALTGSFNIQERKPKAAVMLITPAPPPPTPSNVDLMSRIDRIEGRIEGHEALIEVQSNSFDATVSRIESNLNLLLAMIAIVSILVALVGFGVVRMWIRSQVEEQVRGIASDEISRLAADELARLRKEWEPRFQALYEEYQGLLRRHDDR